jgi:uncharacterized membrane protein
MNSSTITRLLFNLYLGLVLSLIVFSVLAYDDLPARIPTHFNAAGVPDGYGSRASWWLLLSSGVIGSGVTAAIIWWMPQKPSMLNLPSKPEILALPVEAQRAVVRQAQPGMMLIVVSVAVVFWILQYGVWSVSQGRAAPLLGSVVFILPVFAVAAIPAVLIPVGRELTRQQAALRTR